MIITTLQQLVPRRHLHQYEALAVAEKQAQRLRAYLDVTTPAISDQQLRSLPGVVIEEVAKLGVSGATRQVGDLWIVLTNADEAAVRRRFTIAHEIKHILDDQTVSHLRQTGNSSPEPTWLTERVCDYFAACLLMPRMWVKRAWTTSTQNEISLAKMFNVSLDAIRIRLQQIGLTERPNRCDVSTRDVIPLPNRIAAA